MSAFTARPMSSAIISYSWRNLLTLHLQLFEIITCRLICLDIISWLLEFYILATSKIISGWVWTCDSTHLWRFYSASPLGDQADNTTTWYPDQSHYPDTEPPSHCPVLIMLSACLGSDKYKVSGLTSPDQRFESHDLPKREMEAQFILVSVHTIPTTKD